MGEVIEADFNDMFYEIDNSQGVLIVRSKSTSMMVGFNSDGPVIGFDSLHATQSRENLARFLWAAAYLVDSEQRWAEDKYVGRNYE